MVEKAGGVKWRFSEMKPVVGIIMGSDSDLPVMREAGLVLKEFGVPYELKILSAHRTPGATGR